MCCRNLLQPLVGSPKATPTAMVFPNNAVMSQSSLGGANIDMLLHSTAPSCGGSTGCIDLDTDQININDVLSLLPDGWDTAIMQPQGVSTCGAMTTETSLAHVAQNKLGTIATATMTSQCSADRTNLHARMLGVNKAPGSPRYLGQRSPRFMAQRSPGMNTNTMLNSQLQQTISQAGLPSGAVGSGLVGLARMMSPTQQGKSGVCLCACPFPDLACIGLVLILKSVGCLAEGRDGVNSGDESMLTDSCYHCTHHNHHSSNNVS